MSSVNHEYRVLVAWTGGRDGQGKVEGTNGLSESLRTPPEFGGPGGATNPEELLTSAIASCYSITFGIIAANRKLPYTAFEVEAVGNVRQEGMAFTYDKVTLKPTITLAADATPEQEAAANDMALKADHYCIVTNTVRDKVEVVVEPTIRKG
jgi:peroxiredoxin-like protein